MFVPYSLFSRKLVSSIGIVVGLSSCANFSYYTQAVRGQMDVWRRTQPINTIIADPNTEPTLRHKLTRVTELREFASRELGLPRNQSYTHYADLKRQFAVWNVFAAPALSVELKKWCFIQAGCISYRGYFSKKDATHYANNLRKQGYDVYVGGVRAYSTLGWFDDPVLNTFTDYSELELARLIFHELAHQVVYVSGDSMFNESFATAVEYEGVMRWSKQHGTVIDQATLNTEQEVDTIFAELVLKHRKQLHTIFTSEISDAEKYTRKKRIFDALQNAFAQLKICQPTLRKYDRWFAQKPNNARLATVSIYTQLLPAFQALLKQENGDMSRFFQAVKAIGELSESERNNRLRAILKAPKTHETTE